MPGITIIKSNTAHFLVAVLIANDGEFVSGLDVDYEIRKISDDSLITSGTLSEITNAYVSPVTIMSEGEYIVSYFTPTGYENGAEQLVVTQFSIDDIGTELELLMEKICRVLGLSQENFRIINRTYGIFGSNKCLTSATTRIYENASDAQNDTNHIAEYQMTATYNSEGELTDYLVVKA